MGYKRNSSRTWARGAAVAAITLFAQAVPAYAQTQTYSFDLPAQDLGSALRGFARASHQQVTFDSRAVRGKKSPAVKGTYTARAALDLLIAGAGLTVENGRSGLFILRPVIVQIPVRSTAPVSGEATAGSAAATDESAEIVVTGSNIRGNAQITSPIVAYSAKEIEATGYSNVQELVESIPQNFGGGATNTSNDGALGPGISAGTNAIAASSINLRGLGTSGTLTLLNGHRLASTQFGRSFDVSQLPIGAIERVEIVPDGASAIYGSDAIGGVVNFILKRDYEGFETLVRYGFDDGGSRKETTVAQSAGLKWNSGGILGNVQYQRFTRLSSTERDFATLLKDPFDLLPASTAYSGTLSVNQSISSDVSISLDALYSDRDGVRFATATTDALRRSDFSGKGLNVHGGLTANLSSTWSFDASVGYGTQKDFSNQIRIPITGAQTQNDTLGTYETNSVDAVLRGQFGQGPRALKFATGASLRTEKFHQIAHANGAVVLKRQTSRNVAASFLEASWQILSKDDNIPILKSLFVSGAVRHDDYSDFGGTTNYRVGMSANLVGGFRVRANYSTSFRAPNVSELLDINRPPNVATDFALNPNGPGNVPILFVSGGGAVLKAERARSFSFGAEYSPDFIPGLVVEGGYYNIHYRDRIDLLPFSTQALQRQDIYSPALIPFANDAEVQAYVNNAVALGGIYTDTAHTGLAGIRYAFDRRSRNIAVLNQTGFDFSVRYSRPLAAGRLTTRANIALINHIRTQLAPGATVVDTVDTVSNPIGFRGRADIGWSGEPGSINLAVNYQDNYRNTLSALEPVASLTTVDLTGRVNIGWMISQPSFEGVTLGIAVRNLFNTNPPYIKQLGTQTVNYDVGNGNPENRVISFELRTRF